MDLALLNLDSPVEVRGFERGEERVMGPGDFFYVPPGHDSYAASE